MDALDIHETLFPLFEDAFPVASGRFTVRCVNHDDLPLRVDDALYAFFQAIEWDTDARESVMNVSEQEVFVCDQRVHELPERLAAGLHAHAIVQNTLLVDYTYDGNFLLPADLFDPRVFRLKSARTVGDFVRSLATKSRLNVPELLTYDG